MSEEQLNAEIARLENQQKALENDWHAIRGAIAALKNVIAMMQAPKADADTEPETQPT